MVGVHLQARARRYPILTTLRFRQRENEEWRSAWTVDMSRTGVLFGHDGPAPEKNSGIEFVVALPVLTGAAGTLVRCTGHVARIEPAGPRRGSWSVAATIDRFEFLERPQE